MNDYIGIIGWMITLPPHGSLPLQMDRQVNRDQVVTFVKTPLNHS